MNRLSTMKALHAKIGELTLENGVFGRSARQGGRSERKSDDPIDRMICRWPGRRWRLGISRGSVYYLPRPVAATDLVVMRRIDELHLNFPFAGSRMLRDLLAGEGFAVERLHVATLMKRIGIEALYRQPSTSKPAPGHKIYPYLLRKLAVHDPTRCGPWTSRISRWRAASCIWRSLSTGSAAGFWPGGCRSTMEAAFCVEALEETLSRYGTPAIFNTDQGSQFTSAEFTGALLAKGIAISMDSKGAWRDNVFVERLWRTIKYGGGLPARLRHGERRTQLTRRIHHLLQLASPAFEVLTGNRRIGRSTSTGRRRYSRRLLTMREAPT